MPRRRVTADEEKALLAAARRVERARDRVDAVLADRDRLIADLVEDNARVSDIGEILGLTVMSVWNAAKRALG